MGLPSNTNALQNGFAQGYQIGRSLRFRNSASAYLSRTFGSNGSQQTWTWSGWVKAGRFGSQQPLFCAYSNTTNYGLFTFSANAFISATDTLKFYTTVSNVSQAALETAAVFRDPSAWYHILLQVDTTQATANNRVRIYVNGVQQTLTGTQPSQNTNLGFYNTTSVPQQIGALASGTYGYFDGYMAEINFIDGQSLSPSSFGVYDSNGIWQPIKYTGTYGTNGFYLPFSNTTSTTTLVADASGNGNNWTPNNISLTSGVTYDSMIDSPTNSNVGGNFCVLNPLNRSTSALPATIVDGNLKLTTTTSGAGSPGAFSYAFSTFAMQSGKYYAEFIANYASGSAGSTKFGLTNNFTFNYNGGNYIASNFTSAYTQVAPGTIVQIAYDATNGLYWFGTNGTFTGDPAAGTGGTSLTAPAMFFVEGYNDSVNRIDVNANFGQRPFSYTPPAGFNALNTANLPQPLISNGANYMAATLYTGNGSTNNIVNSASSGGNNPLSKTFYPDLVWMKSRGNNYDNTLYDSIRGTGTTAELSSNQTGAEGLNSIYCNLTSFNSNGFSLGTTSSTNIINNNGGSFVAWQWLAGAGSSSSNTSGSITSTVSVSAQSGFSVVTYTGSGANATVGHSLGVAPSMVIVKSRNLTVEGWNTYHTSLAAGNVVQLNATIASTSAPTMFTTTLPTSSVFSVGTNTGTNGSGSTYVAYCFAAVRNYSAFGSYTGNGSSDGPFIYTGFRPRFVMIKGSSFVSNWNLNDSSRSSYNLADLTLRPNLSNAEFTSSGSGFALDFLSNGFKLRANYIDSNSSGDTFIYMAFAENPFQIARAR